MGRDESVFGLHRRERIAFLGKFGVARLGRLKEGLGRSKITHFKKKRCKTGIGKNVFGPYRRERIAVLAELWKLPEISRELHQGGGQSLSKGQDI